MCLKLFFDIIINRHKRLLNPALAHAQREVIKADFIVIEFELYN